MVDRMRQRRWQTVGRERFECQTTAYSCCFYNAMKIAFKIGVLFEMQLQPPLSRGVLTHDFFMAH
jgi:hypothetical protein